MRRKLISLFLTAVMVCGMAPAAFAANDDAAEAANVLYELGLFQGTGTDADGKPIFDLGRTPTRHGGGNHACPHSGQRGRSQKRHLRYTLY